MKKKTLIIILAILSITGSLVTFYGYNLFCSDISNMFYGINDVNFLSTIPFFMISLDFTLAILFVYRFYKNEGRRKALVKRYTMILMIFSYIGMFCAILSSPLVYHSMIKPYPFNNYLIYMIFINLALSALAIYFRFIFIKGMKDDTDEYKPSFKYIIYTIALSFIIYYSLNRFGALLFAPLYVYYRTLHLTIYFYISIMMPMLIIWNILLIKLDFYKDKDKLAKVISIVLSSIFIVSCILVLVLGYNHTEVISSISPALPLERLATMPMGSIFIMVYSLLLSFIMLYKVIKK